MQSSLAITALVMGLAGGPHCIAMCGAACAGLGQAAGERRTQALWSFQLGRLLGYSALGGLAAATVQGLGWLTTQSAALRPFWTMPCGLLYSALMVAALSNDVWSGALVMALFALGSSVSLWAGPWLLLRLGNLGDGRWGMRLAGLALAGLSAWALWMGLVHDQAPWCVTPV